MDKKAEIVGFAGTRKGVPVRVLKKIFSVLQGRLGRFEVIVGDCVGVDQQVYEFCKANGIPVRVVAVKNNWGKISYRPDPSDVIEYVSGESLKRRLAKRTVRLVEILSERKGVLIAILDENSKGTKLAVETARKLGVPVKIVRKKAPARNRKVQKEV